MAYNLCIDLISLRLQAESLLYRIFVMIAYDDKDNVR